MRRALLLVAVLAAAAILVWLLLLDAERKPVDRTVEPTRDSVANDSTAQVSPIEAQRDRDMHSGDQAGAGTDIGEVDVRRSAGVPASDSVKAVVGCTVRGRVVDRSRIAIAGVEVWLVPQTHLPPHVFERHDDEAQVFARTRTTPTGAFEFSPVRPGGWQVGLAADATTTSGQRLASLSERISIGSKTTHRDVELIADRELFVEGVVLAPDGSRQSHASVQAYGLDSFFKPSARSTHGSFVLGPLLAGRYRLLAHGHPHAPSEPMEVDAGARGVVLHLRPGGVLEGTVLDDVAPTRPFELRLMRPPSSCLSYSVTTTSTQGDGSFRITGLETGTYEIVARGRGDRYGVLREITVVGGELTRRADVRIVDSGHLRIRCDGSEGMIHVCCDGTLIHVLPRPERGAMTECAVPPGRIRVALVGHTETNPTFERAVDLAPGEIEYLDL